MNIYQLKDEYMDLLDHFDDYEEEEFMEKLKNIQGSIDEKLENTALYTKNLEADVEALKAEEKRLAGIRKVKENRIGKMKKNMHMMMSVYGVRRIDGNFVTIYTQTSGESLDLSDDFEVPEEFYKPQAPKLDKVALLKAVKGGAEFKGVGTKRTESMVIK